MKKYISIMILILLTIVSINVEGEEIPTAVGTFTCNQNQVYIGDTFYVTFWIDTNFETGAVTARQIKWTEHADLLFQGGKGAIFLDPWNVSMTDDGDLQSQGNLTYLMVLDMENKHYGNSTVFQMQFMAKSKGTFQLWIPNVIDYGPASGQPGLDVALADNAYTNVFKLQVKEEDGGSNGGSGGGGSGGGGGGGGYVPPTNYPPTAILPTKHYNATINQTITFDGTGSYDDKDIVLYHWFFGDENNVSCNCSTYTYTYTKLGNFTVTLTVKDEEGLTDMTTTNVWVKPPFIPDEPDEPDEPDTNDTEIPDNNQTDKPDDKQEEGIDLISVTAILIGIIIVLAIITILRRK